VQITPKQGLFQRFSRALKGLGFVPGSPAAIAVSGGGDSIALMYLFADWAKRKNVSAPIVVIVDHGLRDESAKEAALVAQWAEGAGFEAHVLRWQGKKPSGNIEDKARLARYRLLGAWCATRGTTNLFVAHTQEDQAETFLLRLGRGSGVDGLSGMRARAPLPVSGITGVYLLRPLLDIGRAELRAYLREIGSNWLDDPMNEDSRFARVRIRKALPQLHAVGVPVQRIIEAADHLARAREALEAITGEFLGRHARLEEDFALVDAAALGKVHREIGLRALSAVLMRVGGAAYRPRFERLESLFDALLENQFAARTLAGCRVGKAPRAKAAFGTATLHITREAPRKPGLAGRDTREPAPKNIITPRNSNNSPQKGRIRPL
jgi:tRNA(Ile)-lysidine synthase